MNRKLVILSTALATILLVAIGLVLFNLYKTPLASKTVLEDERRTLFGAVPSDATVIFHFESLSSLQQMETPYASEVRKFHRLLSDTCGEESVLLSAHYSSKNKLSWLMVVGLSDEKQLGQVADALLDRCQGVLQKRYDNTMLYKATVPNVVYAFYGNYLLASTSQVVLESSLRHLESETSILDDQDFVQSSGLVSKLPVCYLNHSNIGKLYSGVLNLKALGSASFASILSDWSVFSLDFTPESVNFKGRFYASNPQEYFLTNLGQQAAVAHHLCSVLPYNTHWAMTLAPESFADYLASYGAFLGEQNRGMGYTKQQSEAKKKTGRSESPLDWFLAKKPVAVAVAEIPVGEQSETVLMIEVGSFSTDRPELELHEYPGAVAAVLGKLFQATSEQEGTETYTCIYGSTLMVGSYEALTALQAQIQGEVFFTWADYLAQTRLANLLLDQPVLSFIANLNRCGQHLDFFCKKGFAVPLREQIAQNNLSFLALSAYPHKTGLQLDAACLMEQTSNLPVPPRKSEEAAPVYVDDTPVVVPQGPYPVKNFVDGKQNWISQHANHAISYLDHNRKSKWAIPFSAPIAGSVTQIDYYNNRKLQMAFAGGNQLCLLDRVGRWVPPFPVKMKKEALLGPLVYDKTGKGDFRFLILHTDNTLGLYNHRGEPATGWNEITVSETIRALPERVKVGGNYYWLLRTAYRTLIYDAFGKPVADFDQYELMPDSKFVVYSNDAVVVKTKAGKDMILNLKTGELKRYK